MAKRRAKRNTWAKPFVIAMVVVAALLAVGIASARHAEDASADGPSPTPEPSVTPLPSETPSPTDPTPIDPPQTSEPADPEPPEPEPFDKTAYSVTDASSLWVVVNKKHPLDPLKYAPKVATVDGVKVGTTMAPHLRALLDAAAAAGRPLRAVSGYRSYAYQIEVYNRKVATSGRAEADRWSARAGHSEHQTGLTVDVDDRKTSACQLEQCFGNSKAGKWLAAHAAEFGFIIRYTEQNKAITGYEAEPWHIRYVGVPLAQELERTGIDSLEVFFDVTGGGYPD